VDPPHRNRSHHPPPDWDARYRAEGYLFGTAPNEFLVRCRDALPADGLVLCVADGEGRNSVWLAEHGLGVEAFDRSPVGVRKARKLAADRGVTVRYDVGDVDGWPWPEARYDAVAAIFVQFATPAQRRRMFDRILTALRPGGVLLLEGYRVEQLAYGTGGPPEPEQLYTEHQLRTELALFTVDRIDAYDADVREGPAHSGMSAVIDVVARRPL
jgi:SAM-dependent methyltransferase